MKIWVPIGEILIPAGMRSDRRYEKGLKTRAVGFENSIAQKIF